MKTIFQRCMFLVLLIPLGPCSNRTSEGSATSQSKSAPSQDELRQVKQEIKRLSPAVFPGLPAAVVKRLQARGCTVPQAFDMPEAHNVIRGQFARQGQMDWAVLCSNGARSSIRVFWGKPTKCPSRLATEEDTKGLQGIGNDRIGYSRAINAVGRNYIFEHYKRYGGLLPPSLDHQGIDDGFVGKGSKIHYCYEGKWLTLTGAD